MFLGSSTLLNAGGLLHIDRNNTAEHGRIMDKNRIRFVARLGSPRTRNYAHGRAPTRVSGYQVDIVPPHVGIARTTVRPFLEDHPSVEEQDILSFQTVRARVAPASLLVSTTELR